MEKVEYWEVLDLFLKIGYAVKTVDGVVTRMKPGSATYMVGQRLEKIAAENGGRRYNVKKAVIIPSNRRSV